MNTVKNASFTTLLAGLLLGLAACSQSAPSADQQASQSESASESQPEGEKGSKASLQSSSYALTGKQAPDFTLSRLGGGEVTLSDHFGQDIVILDFWATWCSPCRYVMPFLEETAAAFASQDVVLYSVNWGQEPDSVKEYLKEEGLEAEVLLDRQTEVGMNQYDIKGLPATVIIGRDGKIKAFMSGMNAVQNRLEPALEELTGHSPGRE